MNGYELSRNARNLLKLADKTSIKDVTKASPSEIEEYNRTDYESNRAFKKLYRPVTRNIISKTFIIPVSDGAITGYLFERSHSKTISGLNSLIIYFHEGGWILGNMAKCRAVASNICYETGATVLAVDYRLAPSFKFPTAIEDCYEAFTWAAQGARYWKVDPDKIYLLGYCSGGNLALGVSRLARDRKGPKIAGQILLSPLTDGRMRTESYSLYKETPTITAKTLSFYIQCYSREPKDILDPLFSPLLAMDHSRLPATLVICSQKDPLHDDGQLYVEALKSADVSSKFISLPEGCHGFFSYPKAEGWKDIMNTITNFVSGMSVTNVELMTKEKRKEQAKKPHLIVVQ